MSNFNYFRKEGLRLESGGRLTLPPDQPSPKALGALGLQLRPEPFVLFTNSREGEFPETRERPMKASRQRDDPKALYQ